MSRRSHTPGVHLLEHTADVGFQVDAPSLPALFDRAAAGMFLLLRDDAFGTEAMAHSSVQVSVAPGSDPPQIKLDAADTADLLQAWLRELLFLQETRDLDYQGCDFAELDETHLSARILPRRAPRPVVREIKGVTYHELEVRRQPDGHWRARVIFDV